MAALTHRLGSFQRAEDALQEASLSALSHSARDGLPQSPQGWLIRVAIRKALEQLRAEGRDGEREAAVQLVNELLGQDEPEPIPDECLRMIFTSRHPALEPKSRVALTLRAVCGLSSGEIELHLLPDGRVVLLAAGKTGTISDFIGLLAGRTNKVGTLNEFNTADAQGRTGKK